MTEASGIAGPASEDVEIIRNVEVGRGGDRRLTMHLLRSKPRPAGPQPVVVWIFGGAFRMGSKDSGIGRLTPLVQRGYLGACVEYRLSQEATFPAQVRDCKCAIRYLRAHAGELGIDPDRIGAWGASAGGYLVTMLGVAQDVSELEGDGGWSGHSSRVQAVCDFFGPTDFLQMDAAGSEMSHDAPDSPESQLIGGPIQEHPDLVARANPITYVTATYVRAGAPPFLIVHGDRDPLVPYNQSELLETALRQVGAEARLVRLAGAGHGGPAFETPEVWRLVEEFFDRHLRLPQAR